MTGCSAPHRRAEEPLRIVIAGTYRDADTVVFCYADHHDRAYAWAERRRAVGDGTRSCWS